MKHADFKLGMIFFSRVRAPQPYYVTDIGSRVIVASLYALPEDLEEPGKWQEFVIAADELQYCEPGEAPEPKGWNTDEPRGPSEARLRHDSAAAEVDTEAASQMSMFE